MLYILLALGLVPLIASRLHWAYKALPHPALAPPHCLLPLICLSLISFARLSYHMFSFLVYSYREWCLAHGVPLPSLHLLPSSKPGLRLFTGLPRHAWNQLYLWESAASSALFRGFAIEIIDGPG